MSDYLPVAFRTLREVGYRYCTHRRFTTHCLDCGAKKLNDPTLDIDYPREPLLVP